MAEKIDTHNRFITFGKWRGERWTRVPSSYLKWLANQDGEWTEMAKAELKRRGTDNIMKELEISPHAINNASIRLMRLYKWEKNREEGIYSWLLRRAKKALPKVNSEGHAFDDGIKFVFKKGKAYSTLLTVMPHKAEPDVEEEK